MLRWDRVEQASWPVVAHSARTAIAAVAALPVAQLFRLPEAYWAPITTLVITQSFVSYLRPSVPICGPN